MRYFTYISDAKVDMLLPQVPGTLRQRIAAKVGFDIKLLSGSIETERTSLDTRVARVEVVESYILETESIGTPGKPESWIRGDAEARVAHIGEGAIMFVAETPEWTLALGGSAHHLIGAVRRDDVKVGYSFLPRLIKLLQEMDAGAFQFVQLQLPDDAVPGYWTTGLGSGVDAWVALIREAFLQVKGPSQRITFLAKRLLSHQDPGHIVTIATPLYVALED